MYDNNALQERITFGLSELRIPDHPENLYHPITYMLQMGGKRVRPLLTLMAADLFGIEEIDDALPAALAVELFHNFSLVHDDIMDNAPLRRGRRTVHEKWNSNTAILAGDNLLVMAYAQLATCPPDKLPRLLKTFSKMAAEVCEGQQLDVDFEQLMVVSISDYLEMIRLKTSVLLGTALKLGAILADADETDAELIYDFGVNVGLAFQLQDDILDVYGDPTQFGKQLGGDILANKKTYLLLKALEMADTDSQTTLNHWLMIHDQPDAKISHMTALYDQLGAKQAAETAKRFYIEQAYNALDTITQEENRKHPLRKLAKNLLDRTH